MSDSNTITIQLGTRQIAPMGTGTWAWGDFFVWGYRWGNDAEIKATFDASTDAGINLFDTAELYGFGRSEQLLGQFMRQNPVKPLIATKFFPLPWRIRKQAVVRALRGSLRRLGLASVDLYQIHWPPSTSTIETMAEGLADAVEAGLTRSVGVSNYNVDQMRRTHELLAKRGIQLASNQVEYSLLERMPESSGLLAACRELGVTLIAYSPLGMGLLTGKFTPENPPKGLRGRWFKTDYLERLQPLLGKMRDIGTAHAKTVAQVALNWTICKGTLPIPGAKSVRQLQENAGALGWQLTTEEVVALDTISAAVPKPQH
ncbi:MAG: aldo/keto reductase [Anaerolineae bacterium]|nr:aldo/keto reductase [Anaerolineae bacterium]